MIDFSLTQGLRGNNIQLATANRQGCVGLEMNDIG